MKLKFKMLTALLVAGSLAIGGSMLYNKAKAGSPNDNECKKVTICHKTGAYNGCGCEPKYVKIDISWEGWCNGHSKHCGDYILWNPCHKCGDIDKH